MSDTREQFRPPDHPTEHFLLTTVVGSYPKPPWLRSIRSHHENGDIEDNEWEEALDDAARLIVDEHERSGIDVITDGEMRRTEMVEYFAERISGFEFNGPVKVWGHNYFDKPSVIESVERTEPWLLEEYDFATDVGSTPIKIPITGPYTLARWSFNEYYDDTAALAFALSGLAKAEVEQLIEGGARYIQIDEPALATTPDDHEIVGDCLAEIVADIPADRRVGLHVCYGDYSRIYPEMLEYPVDEVDLEQANQDFDALDGFRDPPFTSDLALGVVDVHDTTVESVPEIKANIERGLDIVPPDRLTVSPDCGLKLLPRHTAFEKLRNMVHAAREVEAELDEGTIEPDCIM